MTGRDAALRLLPALPFTHPKESQLAADETVLARIR